MGGFDDAAADVLHEEKDRRGLPPGLPALMDGDDGGAAEERTKDENKEDDRVVAELPQRRGSPS